MAILKCKMCGGDLEISDGTSVAECQFCGSRQTIPTANSEKKFTLFNRANQLRCSREFDMAAGIYESIISEFPSEAEAYWGQLLCKYGIEYVDDPATGKKIPTCHRSSYDSVTGDVNFVRAVENADPAAEKVYREEAQKIEEIRRGILEVSNKEDPYDIFICYKETDDLGDRTLDSYLAQELYEKLTEMGYRVFFARVTLDGILGQDYESYIFSALNSAKIMLVYGTSAAHFNAVWVKNEWSRFLRLVKTEQENRYIKQEDQKKLITCFKKIGVSDLPPELQPLQGQDMNQLGAEQDLIDYIERVLPPPKKASAEANAEVDADPSLIAPLLERAMICLSDGDWEDANNHCERVLDRDPRNSTAYLGKLMAELRVKKQEDLRNCSVPLEQFKNYQKALRYANEALHRRLSEYNAAIKERIRIASLDKIYTAAVSDLRHALAIPSGDPTNGTNIETLANKAIAQFKQIENYKDSASLIEQCKEIIYKNGTALMNSANTQKQFALAAESLKSIPDYLSYKDCATLIPECEVKGATARKDAIYRAAESKAASGQLSSAISLFNSIRDYKDAAERAAACESQQNKQIAEHRRLEKRLKRREKVKKILKFLLKVAVIAVVLLGIWRMMPAIALVPTMEAFAGSVVLSFVLALVWAIYRKFVKKRGCILPFIGGGIIFFFAMVFIVYISQTVFIQSVDDLETPEIERTYSGTYYNGDAILTIESTDESGYLTGTFAFIVDGTYGKYTVEGQIIEKLNTNDMTIKISPDEWLFQPAGFDMLRTVTLEVSDDFERIEGDMGFDLTAGESDHFISTEADLQKLSYSDDVYILSEDIDLSDTEWTPIYNFSGTLIGDNHTISGMTVHASDSNIGFFSILYGRVYNLNFEDASVTVVGEESNIGIVCGSCGEDALLSGITVDGEVIAEDSYNVGGITGAYFSTQMYYLTNNASVVGKSYVGGITGVLSAYDAITMSDLTNKGDVTAIENYAGGLAGHVIQSSYFSQPIYLSALTNEGTLSCPRLMGELIGYLESAQENTAYLTEITTVGQYELFGETWNTDIEESDASDETLPDEAA